MASSWDALQFHVAQTSAYVFLLVVFLLGTAQSQPDLITAGYVVLSLFFLLRPRRLLSSRGVLGRGFRILRVFNYVAVCLLILFQIPWIPSAPRDCPGAELGRTCTSWQSVFGLTKFALVTRDGAVACTSPPEGEEVVECPSPFDFYNGAMPQMLLLLFIAFQRAVL
jgi:hypothetical protein